MTTEHERAYEVRLDREGCDGVFACLVRDERFAEADDGLATVASADVDVGDGVETARFTDDRIEDARQAARACPLDAIEVEVVGGE